MKNISIIKFIRLVFASVAVIVVLLFWVFITIDQKKYSFEQEERYTLLATHLISQFDDETELQEWYDHYQVNPINDPDNQLKLQILNNAQTIYQKELINARIRIFNLNEHQYIYLQSRGYNIMLEEKNVQQYNPMIAIVLFVLILLVLIVLYSLLMKKIEPLKQLHSSIKEFSKGNLKIKINNDSKDEIGQIAHSFNDAVTNIAKLIESRNLFMRNMMHELKTPITKGNFLVEMLQEESQEKRDLQTLFEDMNLLVTTLANIEKTTLKDHQLIKEKINIQQLCEQIIESNEDIIFSNLDHDLYVNKELFLIVIKNLVQNGLKYSTQKPISIKFEDQQFIFESFGEPLKQSLEYYLQPFAQEKKNSDGFGLGLYIVNEILNLHNMKLQYMHKKGKNIFTII